MKLEAFPSHFAARAMRLSSDELVPELVGSSEAFRAMRQRLEQVAATDATVLLLGETGTGKGLAAHAIHRLSHRRNAPFVNVDCTSLPPTLIESELFGREKGAFTDARSTQAGRFELAHGGTIFLDEIGELPAEAQAKLLRILQYGEFERLGSPRTIRVNVRIIAATNRNLVEEARAGRFRRDLYYRLNVFPITMPPLRQRKADIPALAQHLVDRLAQRHRRRIDPLPRSVIETLTGYDWPGNVRELENVLERALISTPDAALRFVELPVDTLDVAPCSSTSLLVDVEREHVLRVLRASAWRIEGPRGAATRLGLKPSTLRSRMRKLGIRRAAEPGNGPAAFVA
ncbi:MAG TPA: sigma 54-interacting transcriptional regulator [Vicinamibacterales bacterium]|nr:sigma 54-interacting transcriptional regulator [Vicinamibacterales bacterium]